MSATIQSEDFVNNLLFFLTETFEGTPEFPTAYLDTNVSFFDACQAISAEQASTPIANEGMTLAAHVEHTRFYIDLLLKHMQGRTTKDVNWDETWQQQTVSEDAWNALKSDLKTNYQEVKNHIKNINTWDDVEIGDALAIVVHSAYHLGAIRQIMKVLADADST
jgi:uncharacterized damage-inducible protein DinB